MNFIEDTRLKSVNFWNNMITKEIEREHIEYACMKKLLRVFPKKLTIESVARWNSYASELYRMNIFVSGEPYTTGINYVVSVTTFDLTTEDLYNNKLSSGMYGDNGEFDTYAEAFLFGAKAAKSLITKRIKEIERIRKERIKNEKNNSNKRSTEIAR